MRILIAIHSLRRGGAERIAIEVARGLVRRGHIVKIAALLDTNAFPEETSLMDAESLIEAGNYRWPGGVPVLAKRLNRIVREFKPDIVQIHTPTVAVVAAFGRLKIPVQQVVHGYGTMDRAPSLKGWLVKQADRSAIRTLHAQMVVVAPAMVPLAARYWNKPQSEVRCAPNGTDIIRFPFVARGATSTPTIIMVGTLAAVKRHRLAVAAMPSLRAEVPGLRLKIVGDGPLRRTIEADIVSSGLQDCVTLLGQRPDIPDLMAQADLLWHLSESEGLPLAVAEAMASGLPVIGCDVRGVRDIVVHEETGMLIAPDPDELVRRTVETLEDRSRYARFASAARRRAENEFSLNKMIENHERLLSEQLSAIRRGPVSHQFPS